MTAERRPAVRVTPICTSEADPALDASGAAVRIGSAGALTIGGSATDSSKCDMARHCREVTSAYAGTVGLRICATCSTIKS